MCLPEFGGEFDQARDDALPGDGKATYLADLAERDADRHAIQEPNQDRSRKEVSQRAQPEEPGNNTENASQKCERHRERVIQVLIPGRQRAHSSRYQRTGSRIRTENQLSGCSEERVGNQREDARVQTNLRLEPGQLRVRNTDGQGYSRNRQTRYEVTRDIGTAIGQQVGQTRRNSRKALYPPWVGLTAVGHNRSAFFQRARFAAAGCSN